MKDRKYRLVTTAEAREIFENETEERDELTNEQKYALEHARQFSRIKSKSSNNLVEELMENVPRMKDHLAYKIADFLPDHEDDVKLIFSRERFTLGEEDIKKIIELVKPHRDDI